MTNRSQYYTATGTTAIAGIVYLKIIPNAIGLNINRAIFFIISDIVQLFWLVPMRRTLGRIWYYIGIVGNIL